MHSPAFLVSLWSVLTAGARILSRTFSAAGIPSRGPREGIPAAVGARSESRTSVQLDVTPSSPSLYDDLDRRSDVAEGISHPCVPGG